MSWEITAICVACGVRGETIFTDEYSGGTVIPETWTAFGQHFNGSSIYADAYCEACSAKLAEEGRKASEARPSPLGWAMSLMRRARFNVDHPEEGVPSGWAPDTILEEEESEEQKAQRA